MLKEDISSLIQIKEFSERPRIVPCEVICLNVVARALSSNLNALLGDVVEKLHF